MNKKYYTGIGSRNVTDKKVEEKVNKIVFMMANKGLVLRSGGADGMDSLFEYYQDLYNGDKKIYLPWKNFNKNNSTFFNISDDAMKMAEQFHPFWTSCSIGAKKLHARNCYQVLGESLNEPSEVIICWKNPYKSSGTDQAIRVANFYGIPVFNIYSDEEYNSCLSYLDTLLNNK